MKFSRYCFVDKDINSLNIVLSNHLNLAIRYFATLTFCRIHIKCVGWQWRFLHLYLCQQFSPPCWRQGQGSVNTLSRVSLISLSAATALSFY